MFAKSSAASLCVRRQACYLQATLVLRYAQPGLTSPSGTLLLPRWIRCIRKRVFNDSPNRRWLVELTDYRNVHHQKHLILTNADTPYHSVSRDLRMVPVSQSYSYQLLPCSTDLDASRPATPASALSALRNCARLKRCGERAERLHSVKADFQVPSTCFEYVAS